jgi:hypothetical protein
LFKPCVYHSPLMLLFSVAGDYLAGRRKNTSNRFPIAFYDEAEHIAGGRKAGAGLLKSRLMVMVWSILQCIITTSHHSQAWRLLFTGYNSMFDQTPTRHPGRRPFAERYRFSEVPVHSIAYTGVLVSGSSLTCQSFILTLQSCTTGSLMLETLETTCSP